MNVVVAIKFSAPELPILWVKYLLFGILMYIVSCGVFIKSTCIESRFIRDTRFSVDNVSSIEFAGL